VRSRWKKIRYRLEWMGLLVASRLVPLLPRKVCFGIALAAGALISVLDRRARRVGLANLEAAFGDRFSPGERARIVRESFQHFARTMLDLFWSRRLTKENARDYVEFENLEEVDRCTGPARNFILATYHYSNFEWLSLAFGYAGITGMIVSQEFKNSLLDSIFKEMRERCGHEFVPREGGIIRLYRALRRGRTTALLVDLTVPPTEGGAVAIECFGLKTCVTSAHAWLHQRTGVPIIPGHCEPLPGGRYRVVLHPHIKTTGDTTLREIAQACWKSFEPYVCKNPAPWLWMYKHWRYKPLNATRAYPFYAGAWKAFDRLLAQGTAEATPDAGSGGGPCPVDKGAG
jgi:Kdo2-lipid IVA lauroyltransferase/acyltransferase